jgi:hypothetical protein
MTKEELSEERFENGQEAYDTQKGLCWVVLAEAKSQDVSLCELFGIIGSVSRKLHGRIGIVHDPSPDPPPGPDLRCRQKYHFQLRLVLEALKFILGHAEHVEP